MEAGKKEKMSGYSRDTVMKAMDETIRLWQRRKSAGRITLVVDMTQGAIAGAKIRKESAIKK